MLLGTKGIATRSKDAIGCHRSLPSLSRDYPSVMFWNAIGTPESPAIELRHLHGQFFRRTTYNVRLIKPSRILRTQNHCAAMGTKSFRFW